jgi:hypothetical protein
MGRLVGSVFVGIGRQGRRIRVHMVSASLLTVLVVAVAAVPAMHATAVTAAVHGDEEHDQGDP